jgi:hypothetical protein
VPLYVRMPTMLQFARVYEQRRRQDSACTVLEKCLRASKEQDSTLIVPVRLQYVALCESRGQILDAFKILMESWESWASSKQSGVANWLGAVVVRLMELRHKIDCSDEGTMVKTECTDRISAVQVEYLKDFQISTKVWEEIRTGIKKIEEEMEEHIIQAAEAAYDAFDTDGTWPANPELEISCQGYDVCKGINEDFGALSIDS